MTKARKLRELLARREFFIAPGAYDAMTARLVEQAGLDRKSTRLNSSH